MIRTAYLIYEMCCFFFYPMEYVIRKQKTDVREQISEDRNQKTGIRKQISENRRQKTENRNQKTENGNQKADIEAVGCHLPESE